jgi:hypothetical protein
MSKLAVKGSGDRVFTILYLALLIFQVPCTQVSVNYLNVNYDITELSWQSVAKASGILW